MHVCAQRGCRMPGRAEQGFRTAGSLLATRPIFHRAGARRVRTVRNDETDLSKMLPENIMDPLNDLNKPSIGFKYGNQSRTMTIFCCKTFDLASHRVINAGCHWCPDQDRLSVQQLLKRL